MSIDKAKEFKLITGANKDELRGYALSYIDRIAFLKRENANQKACLDMFAEQDGPEWVACSERMPEEGKGCLGYTSEGEQGDHEFVMHIGGGVFHRHSGEAFVPMPGTVAVTHWMPLPGPPKGVAQ